MNLRISDGRLRFRVTREEWAQLLDGGQLELSLMLPHRTLRYRIRAVDQDIPLRLEEQDSALILRAGREALKLLARQLPSREGIEYEQDGVRLALEVDVRKSPT